MQFNFIENNRPYSIDIVENKLLEFSSIEVDRLWDLSKQKNKYLFNDNIFYVDSIKENKIYGYFAEYKYWHVQETYKSETINLPKFRVAGVTGVIRMSNAVLACKRSNNVTQDKNIYELGPSGGLSNNKNKNVTFINQFIDEFEEELNVSANNIESINQLGLLIDNKESVIDVVLEVFVKNDFKNTIKPTNEYQKFKWLSLNKETQNILSPSSEEIMKHLILKGLK